MNAKKDSGICKVLKISCNVNGLVAPLYMQPSLLPVIHGHRSKQDIRLLMDGVREGSLSPEMEKVWITILQEW